MRSRISLRLHTNKNFQEGDGNTLEFPGEVDGQDDGQRQQADHGHEQDDVALERQVGDGVDAALAADLFVPGGVTERRGKYFRKSQRGGRPVHDAPPLPDATLIRHRWKVR